MTCIEFLNYVTNFLAFPLLPILLLFMLWRSPKAGWSSSKIKLGSDKEKLTQLQNSTIQAEISNLQNYISNETIDFGSYVQNKVAHSIDYAISRHDWYEQQRGKVLQYTISITAIIITVVGALLSYDAFDINELRSPLYGSATIALIIINFSIIYYNVQLDADRPYRLVSDIRHWFFRYNIVDESSKADKQLSAISKAEAVITQRNNFFSRVLELDNIEKHLREDYEQLFILHVLQNYKTDSLKKMRWTLAYLVIFISFEIILLFIIAWHVT
jgi:hypothetical protein